MGQALMGVLVADAEVRAQVPEAATASAAVLLGALEIALRAYKRASVSPGELQEIEARTAKIRRIGTTTASSATGVAT